MATAQEFAPFDLGRVLAQAEAIKAARSESEDKDLQRQMNFHNLLGQAATNIAAKMRASGLQSGTPEFQTKLDAIGKPYQDFFRKIGAPVEDGPIHWDTIEAFSGMGSGKVHSIIPVSNGDGTANYHAVQADGSIIDTGKRVPIRNLGQGLMATSGDGGLQVQAMPGYANQSAQIEAAKEAAKQGQRIGTVTLSTGAEVPMRMGDAVGGSIPVGPGNGRPPVTATFSTPEGAAQALELARTMPAGAERDALIKAASETLIRKGQQPQTLTASPTVGFSAAEKSRIAVEQARQEAQAKADIETQAERDRIETERLKAAAKEQGKAAGEKQADAPQRLRVLDNRLADINAAIDALEPSSETTQFGMPRSFGFQTGGFGGGGGINPVNSATAMEFTNNPNWRTLQRVGKGEELSKAAEDMAKQGQITEGERALLTLATGLDPAKHRSEQIYQQLMQARARLGQLRKQWEGAGGTTSPIERSTPTATDADTKRKLLEELRKKHGL